MKRNISPILKSSAEDMKYFKKSIVIKNKSKDCIVNFVYLFIELYEYR